MATTIIRLDADVKARVAVLAEREGKTAHALTQDAIARTVERDDAFHDLADTRWAAMRESGASVSWGEAKAWLEARSRGEASPRPLTRKAVG